MQQRRLRPGDVLDDYCPRERRITDHAIVAMIEDKIKQTRCVACDVEHEYKQGRVPPQRRKKTPALFTQVLDGLQGPTRPPHLPDTPDQDPNSAADAEMARAAGEAPGDLVPADALGDAVLVATPIGAGLSGRAPSRGGTSGGAATNGDGDRAIAAAAPTPPVNDHYLQDADAEAFVPREDGPVRRPLIRATLPRPEGQPAQPSRAMPEFTIRQPGNGRSSRHGGRRRGPHQPQGPPGAMRFGRGASGQRSEGARGPGGHGGGQGRHGGQGGQGGHGGPNGNRGGGSRRGGKKR